MRLRRRRRGDDIRGGVVWEFEVRQVFMMVAFTLVSVPILMVFLSVTLPSRRCG